MKNVRELETYGAILIGCGIMAYTLMLASVDAPVWANERRHPKGCLSFLNRICRIYGVYGSPAC